MGKISRLTELVRFLYNWKIRRRTVVRSLPLEISIEPTNVCNFKCAFCNQSDPGHFKRVEKSSLTSGKARAILKKIREFGYDKTLLHWTLDGEPFLNQEFEELCAAAREFGFTDQYFATNGLLLTWQRARKLPDDVNFTFTVDYCADEKYFEQVRGTRGAWEKIRDNITQILLDDSLSNLKFILYDISTFRTQDDSAIQQNAADMRKLFPSNGRIKYLFKTFHNATGYLDAQIARRSVDSDKVYNLCPYPWSSLSIASNGEVVACCRDLEHKSVLGNVYQSSLVDIWNGAAIQQLRRNLLDKSPAGNAACAGCDMPYDQSKFTLKNIVSSVLNRLQFFK